MDTITCDDIPSIDANRADRLMQTPPLVHGNGSDSLFEQIFLETGISKEQAYFMIENDTILPELGLETGNRTLKFQHGGATIDSLKFNAKTRHLRLYYRLPRKEMLSIYVHSGDSESSVMLLSDRQHKAGAFEIEKSLYTSRVKGEKGDDTRKWFLTLQSSSGIQTMALD